MIVCTKCRVLKDYTAFSVRGGTGKRRAACRQCVNADNLRRYHTRPSTKDAHREASRRYNVKKYGLTVQQFSEIYVRQAGLCKICAQSLVMTGPRRAASAQVDHDHKTGKVRGLLCVPCNQGLGMFKDDASRLARAIRYLQE